MLQVSNGYASMELNNQNEAEELKSYLEQKNFANDSKEVRYFKRKGKSNQTSKLGKIGRLNFHVVHDASKILSVLRLRSFTR